FVRASREIVINVIEALPFGTNLWLCIDYIVSSVSPVSLVFDAMLVHRLQVDYGQS
ncbi:17693_t:CDS:2, partial [Gigaspora rosea]